MRRRTREEHLSILLPDFRINNKKRVSCVDTLFFYGEVFFLETYHLVGEFIE